MFVGIVSLGSTPNILTLMKLMCNHIKQTNSFGCPPASRLRFSMRATTKANPKSMNYSLYNKRHRLTYLSRRIHFFPIYDLFFFLPSVLLHGSVSALRQLRFRKRLIEGSVYSLSGFDVTRSNPKFWLTDVPVSIRFFHLLNLL